MSGNNSIHKEKLNSNIYPDKGSNLKKIIFIICISAVFFFVLLFFKNAESQPGLNSTSKNKSFSERIVDGISALKFQEDNSPENTKLQAGITCTKAISKSYNSQNDNEDTYYARSLNNLLKSAETYLLNTAGELYQNLTTK